MFPSSLQEQRPRDLLNPPTGRLGIFHVSLLPSGSVLGSVRPWVPALRLSLG
jgi:hypothetical protein